MNKILHEKFMFITKVSLIQSLVLATFFTIGQAMPSRGQNILDKEISLKIKDASLRETLSMIESIAEIKFFYISTLIPESDKITLDISKQPLRSVLDKILTSRKISYEADGLQIILKPQAKSKDKTSVGDIGPNGSSIIIKGKVADQKTQEPLPGVSIMVKGSNAGTSTDATGQYAIEVSNQEDILIFSFIGYTTVEEKVGGRLEVNVLLSEDIATLGEVVVVGYGTTKKTDVISSISSVGAQDLTFKSSPSFESSLQGVAAGVSVLSQSGSPGAPVRVLIRGTNSINLSTDPLYIIDGMPITTSSGGVGSTNLSPMSLINQNDIETIEVLKDAAATSIYGSRGSNGVIIITTKSGKKGEGSLNVNYTSGISNLIKTPRQVGYANTQEWFKIMNKAYANSGEEFNSDMREYYMNVPLSNTVLSSPKLTLEQAQNINTNWYDQLFHTGTYQDVNISSSRGTDHTSFFVSGNYRKDQGVQKNNSLDRLSFRSNLDFNPFKSLTISTKMTFGYTKNNQRNSGITSISVNALPWLPVYELDNPKRYYNAYTGANPAAINDAANTLNQTQQYRGLGGVSLTYRVPFVDGLQLRSELNGDIIQSNKTMWQSGLIRANGDNTKPQSAAYDEVITTTGVNSNAYANFDKTIGAHTFSAVAGIESTRSFQLYKYISGTALNGNYQEVGIPNNLISIISQKRGERYLMGYFGRFNYKIKDKYLLGLSLRRDGSSVFTKANRWGTFAAVSAGWILSDENFMSFLGNKTFIKLRGSYGEVGNQFIPENLNLTQYNKQPVVYGGSDIQGVNGTIPSTIGVTNLQWETTRSFDVGFDFGFFNNRLNGSVAYYSRYVANMLLQAGLPYSTGVSSDQSIQLGQGTYDRGSSNIWGNFGDMTNSGIELELHSINYDKNGLKWTTSFTFGVNKNEIRKLTSDIDASGGGLENIYGNTISRKGDRRAMWYIADYAGVDPLTGVPMIYARDEQAFAATGETKHKKNNVGEDVLLPATITNVRANRFYQEGKSGDPKYQGGITNNLQYKGFDVSVMISFSGGNYILDYDRQQSTIVNPTRNILRDVYDQSWQKPGDVATYPELRAKFTYVVGNQNLNGFSGAEAYHNGFLYKGDFVRLRNVTLGYSIPSSLSNKISVKSIRAYVSGSNLITLTKYPGFDPEGVGTASVPGFIYYANAIPQLRSFSCGLEFKF